MYNTYAFFISTVTVSKFWFNIFSLNDNEFLVLKCNETKLIDFDVKIYSTYKINDVEMMQREEVSIVLDIFHSWITKRKKFVSFELKTTSYELRSLFEFHQVACWIGMQAATQYFIYHFIITIISMGLTQYKCILVSLIWQWLAIAVHCTLTWCTHTHTEFAYVRTCDGTVNSEIKIAFYYFKIW